MSTSPSRTTVPAEPYLLADHPVLDMLNTVATVSGDRHEFWQTDADVIRWLIRTGWVEESAAADLPRQGLAEAARDLRETIRALVEAKKGGKRADPGGLNQWLRRAASHPVLTWTAAADIRLERQRKRETAEDVLAPLAEAAAEFLVEADFRLVRKCEHPECSLWFYDRTKSRRRRWCSMALCGNRSKVARFRKRRQQRTKGED